MAQGASSGPRPGEAVGPLCRGALIALGALCVWCWGAAASAQPVEGLPRASGPLLRASWAAGLVGEQRGAVERATGGHRRPVRGSIEALMARAGQPDVERVELAFPLSIQLEAGLLAIGISERGGVRLETLGLTGQGVIVGIIDTGVDWRHPDFAAPEGGSRIAWLLDLTLGARQGAHLGIETYGGALWSADELSRGLEGGLTIPSGDPVGHGTHVAGIAAGGGLDGQSPAGVAPGATLIVVKASRGESTLLDEADVMAGVRFVLERADAAGMPAVVNLSLGGHSGPHDGSTDFERALSSLFDGVPGRALVVASGNDGGRDVHASGHLVGDRFELPVRIAPYVRDDAESSYAVVDLWIGTDPVEEGSDPVEEGSDPVEEQSDPVEEGSDPVEVELIAPDGRSTGRAAPGQTLRSIDGRLGSLTVSFAEAEVGRPALRQVVALIQEPVEGPLASGDYVVVIHGGRGGFDAWLPLRGGFEARLAGSLDPGVRLTVPGTVEAAVSVGSYNSRGGWVDRGGEAVSLDVPLGEVSFFSGTGPTSDGRAKPDVIAPGALVASALARGADPLENPRSVFAPVSALGVDPVLEGERRAMTAGTSMSTAFVSGLAALLMEQDPGRTSAQVADVIRATARMPGQGQGQGWDPRAGFGLIDAGLALSVGAGRRGGVLSPSVSAVGVTREVVRPAVGERFEVLILARDELGAPLEAGWSPRVEVEVERGEVAVGEPRPYGELGRSVEVAWVSARGAASVRVSIGGVELAARPQVHFVESRSDVGREAVGVVRGGGGCAQIGRPAGGLGSVWPWALAVGFGAGVRWGFRRRWRRSVSFPKLHLRTWRRLW